MLTALLLATLAAPLAPAQEEVTATYHRLHEAGDAEALVELWKKHPNAVLYTIDADLEGSLALWERADGSPDAAAVGALQDRAMFGARAATRASGHSIFVDYTSAFVGWTDDQKRAFRGGQRAYKASRDAMKAGDAEAALRSASECAGLALPLGDWWGYAMGKKAEGAALRALGRHEEAAASLACARVVYGDLDLVGDHYACTAELADSLVALGRGPRAAATIDAGLALADRLGDGDGRLALLAMRARLERAEGRTGAAEATEAEIERLRGE